MVEGLNTQGMSKSANGTVEKPGKNVRTKAGRNRLILATGWHQLKQKLAYKCRVVEINPAYTSQTCNYCGVAHRASRQGRTFRCVACDHTEHADLNAARNIMATGIWSRWCSHGHADVQRRASHLLLVPVPVCSNSAATPVAIAHGSLP